MMPDESTMLAEAQAEAAARYARSAQQFERDHNCSMGDYMRGNVLHVDGMLSEAHILAPESNQKRPHFLSVDVLIRDVEEGTMVLYPVGTPVNFGSLNIYYPGEEQAMQELLGESLGRVGAPGSNGTGNGTEVQFENPDDVATNFDVESIEGHLVPEQQYQGQPGSLGQGLLGQGPLGQGPLGQGPLGQGPLGQGPLASALFPAGQQPQPFAPGANPAFGQQFPHPAYAGGAPGLYPNQAQPRGGAPLPLSLGDMGIPPFGGQRNQFGPAFQPGLGGQPPYGAPLGQETPGAPGQGNGQNDQNLVLERKPDGGYSLKFKKQAEDALRDGQVPSVSGGPNVLGAAKGLNLAGQAFPFGPNRRFGSPQQPGQLRPGQQGDHSRPFVRQGQDQGLLSFMGLNKGGQSQPDSPLTKPSLTLPGQADQPSQSGQAGQPGQAPGESPTPENQGQAEGETKPPETDTSTILPTPNPNPATPTEDSTTEAPISEEESAEGDTATGTTPSETGGDNTEQSTEGKEGEESNAGDEASSETSGGPPVDATLFGDGFEERLKKYNLELFGKETEDKGDDGSLTGNYRMNNPDICQNLDTVDILYLIASKPQSMDVRDRIRKGYLDKALFEGVKMAHVFLVGLTKSENFLKNLDTEKVSYNDVAMGEYVDAPENSTLKALSGFRWARQYCKQAKHVLYVDESIFVDTDKLVHGLIPTADKDTGGKYMVCPFMPSFPIPRQGPNAVKKPLFPTSTNFRSYCKSYAVLMSWSAMLSMIEASEQMAMFPSPDVYLFGYVPYIIGNLEVYDGGNKQAFHDFGQEVVACYEEKKDRCPILASKASSGRFETLLNLVKDRMKTSHSGWEGDNTVWDMKSLKRVV